MDGTLANLILAAGAEPLGYKLGTLLLTAPLILLAGLRQLRPGLGGGSHNCAQRDSNGRESNSLQRGHD